MPGPAEGGGVFSCMRPPLQELLKHDEQCGGSRIKVRFRKVCERCGCHHSALPACASPVFSLLRLNAAELCA